MRILISQRVDAVPGRSETRDALDQAWQGTLDRLAGAAVEMLPVPNRSASVATLAASLTPDLIVLSGGNDIGLAPERDAVERALLQYACAEGVPVLGVCRGMQMMQVAAHGELQSVHDHVARVHALEALPGADGPAAFPVNSFHNFGISERAVAPGYGALYRHADGTVEAMRHAELPWLGVMWHPERAGAEAAEPWVAAWIRKIGS